MKLGCFNKLSHSRAVGHPVFSDRLSPVVPAQAGTQKKDGKDWTPACAGATDVETGRTWKPIPGRTGQRYLPP